jgi:hypothetical protein
MPETQKRHKQRNFEVPLVILSLLLALIIVATGILLYQYGIDRDNREAQAGQTELQLDITFDPLADADDDGIPNGIECGNDDGLNCRNTDADNDNVPDYFDQDSDSDLISDAIERGSTCPSLEECAPFDTNQDGLPDYRDPNLIEPTSFTSSCANADKPELRPCIINGREITYNQDIIAPEVYGNEDLEIAIVNLPDTLQIGSCSILAKVIGAPASEFVDITTDSSQFGINSTCLGFISTDMQEEGGNLWEFEIKITDVQGNRFQATPSFALAVGAQALVRVNATVID